MPKVGAEPTTAQATAAFTAPPTGFSIPPGAPPPMFAASNPDQTVNAGLANKFNGRVDSLWLLPRKLEKGAKKGVYELYVELNIRSDDPTLGRDGIVTSYMKADQLNQWVPGRIDPVFDAAQGKWIYQPAGNFADGQGGVLAATMEHYMALHLGSSGFPVPGDASGKETAVLPPESWKGWYPFPGLQNNRHGFMKNTVYDQFLAALKKTGYYQKAPNVQQYDFRQFLVGVYAHWVRIPYEWTGGQKPADAKDSDFLAMAEILDLGPISGASGPVTVQVPVQVSVPAMPAAAIAAPVAQVAQVVQPAVAQPIAQPVVQPVPQQAPMVTAAPAAPAPAPAAVTAPPSNDMAAIEAALNESLTRQAQAAGAAGVQVLSALAAAFEELNNKGLNGAQALLYSKRPDWLGGDDRTFFYVEHKGLLASSAEIAMALR